LRKRKCLRVIAVGLVLVMAYIQQLFLQLRRGKRLARLQDQIANAGARSLPGRCAAMSIGFRKIADRLAPQQIIYEFAVLDQGDLRRTHSLIWVNVLRYYARNISFKDFAVTDLRDSVGNQQRLELRDPGKCFAVDRASLQAPDHARLVHGTGCVAARLAGSEGGS
jgi:hypothetical protein